MSAGAEWLVLWSAFFFYVAGGGVAIAALGHTRRTDGRVLALLAAGVALHALAIGMRWERVGNGPFLTLHEVLSSNVWSLALVFALAYWRVPAVRPSAAVVMPVLFVMIAWLVASDPASGHFPPTYRTVWLWFHVGFGKVFLGTVLVAVGLSGVILLRCAGVASPRLACLPPDERLEKLAFRFMAVGFLFESLMLVAGAIWAQDAWGRYWAWDPLETWSFVTWIALATMIHARTTFPVTPRAGATMVIAVFVLAFLTFFGVPFISTAPHKGAV